MQYMRPPRLPPIAAFNVAEDARATGIHLSPLTPNELPQLNPSQPHARRKSPSAELTNELGSISLLSLGFNIHEPTKAVVPPRRLTE
jgi:hypothetical protein